MKNQKFEIKWIDIKSIKANPDNPRREIGDLSDLVETIKQHGILNPPTAKNLGHGRYQIVAGNRRFGAAKLAGLDSIPCVIRAMDDQEAHDIATIENIARKPMDPADECVAVAKMIGNGRNPQDIAVELGRTVRWVIARAKMAELGDAVLQMMRDGIVTLAHAEVLCSITNKERLMDFAEMCGRMSPANLQEQIEKSLNAIDSAPFDHTKTCAKCPYRTSVMTDLFGSDDADKCTDYKCFQGNVQKFREKKKKDLEKKGFQVYSGDERWEFQCGGFRIPLKPGSEGGEIALKLKEEGVKPRIFIEDDGTTSERYFEEDSPDYESIKASKAEKAKQERFDRKKKSIKRDLMEEFVISEMKNPKSAYYIGNHPAIGIMLQLTNQYNDAIPDDDVEKYGLKKISDESEELDFVGWSKIKSNADDAVKFFCDFIISQASSDSIAFIAEKLGFAISERELNKAATERIEAEEREALEKQAGEEKSQEGDEE